MVFQRTALGKRATFLFYPEPVVWVEGPEDIPFYGALCSRFGLACQLKDASGRLNCVRLAEDLVKDNLPYVVVLDGDYDILDIKNGHPRKIVLRRYSIENYLFHLDPIASVCVALARNVDVFTRVSGSFSEFETRSWECLRDLIVCDAAHALYATGTSVLPSHPRLLTGSQNGYVLREANIRRLYEKWSKEIDILDKNALPDVHKRITAYLKRGRPMGLVRGHFLFSLMRNYIVAQIAVSPHKSKSVPNDNLHALLSSHLWNQNLKGAEYEDHRALVKQLRVAINGATEPVV